MSRADLYFVDKFKTICIFIFSGIIIQLNLLAHTFQDGKKSMPFGFSSLRTTFKKKKEKKHKIKVRKIKPLNSRAKLSISIVVLSPS